MPLCHTLRTEHLDAPIAVASPQPRFTWRCDAAPGRWELEVIGDRGRVWSARGDEHPARPVVYDGDPLRSNGAYRWRVRAHDGASWSTWAEAPFAMGLRDADWRAPWVEPAQDDALIERWSIVDWIRGSGPDAAPEDRLRPARHVRQRVEIAGEVVRARLFASARGIYEASLNGVRLGDEVLAPGFDSYAHRISVQAYDVTDTLHAGENVIGMTVADGWWAGRIGLTGSSAQFGDRVAVTWQLHVETADGAERVHAIDETARSAAAPWRYADLFVGERFDARAVQAGWDAPGFDADDWSPVTGLPGGTDVLVPFAGEPVRRVDEIGAVAAHDTPEGTIVDFGQVIAGRVRLTLRDAAPGQRITLEHTETLDADGGWFANIAGINKEQTDVYIAAGAPAETYEPSFTFHGFRYARISGLAAALDLHDVVAVALSSDLAPAGDFACSDERLNRLHQNVVWSQRGNFLSIPTDCPQRERAGWTGDMQVFAPAATRNQRVLPFVERWLANLRADQLPDGRIPITSPRSPFDAEAAAQAQGIGAIVAAAGWSDAIAFVPWAMWEAYGDPRVLEDSWDALTRWIDYQTRTAATELPASLARASLSPERRADQALLYNTGAHFGDWLAPSTLEGRPFHEAIGVAPALTSEYLAPMFQAQTLTLAARVADVLDRADEATVLAAQAMRVREAFAREYVDEHGDLPVRLQGVYVLALAFDMVPADLRDRTVARLVELVHARADRLDTGFLSVPYLLDVLWDAGHRDLARTLLWQDEMPSWLYEVDRGATTVWETWDAVGPDGSPKQTSFNHYAFGCVDDWLFRRLAGIRIVDAGASRIVIEPDLECGLEWVRAHVDTPRGRVAVEWHRGRHIDVAVPVGVSAGLRRGVSVEPLPAGRSRIVLGVHEDAVAQTR